jgi:hypothetical protein
MRTLRPTPEQRRDLLQAATHHAKPYVRERVKAPLFVAQCVPGAVVAEHYLMPARKPAFSPSAPKRGRRSGGAARHRAA